MLVTLAHGSRHPQAAPLISELTENCARSLGVSHMCLDLLEPNLEPLTHALDAGQQVTIVPLLFTQAFHARVDIPALFAPVHDRYPEQVHLTEILGTGEDMAALIAKRATQDAPDAQGYILYAVGSSRKAANEAVKDLAQRVAHILNKPVRVHFATSSRGVMPEKTEHIIPLFSTHGLLLDKINNCPSVSQPLGLDLHDIILNRYSSKDSK
ncbi:MAG: CbiX/SirB N-terminal domain-containing protein [Corynebacterium sp.]|nr:CbiX/SirB N-terminal domain-containing protein [Corynebacterium sp.]